MLSHEAQEISNIININEDAVEFYNTAQEKAEDPQLKSTFANLESLHNSVVINLTSHLRAEGQNVEPKETIAGQAHQFWAKLVASISNDVDETLVKQLEEAEDRCLHSIQDAVESDTITPESKSALQTELVALKKSHDYMKALKDSMKAA